MKKALLPAATLVTGLAAGWFGHQYWVPPAGTGQSSPHGKFGIVTAPVAVQPIQESAAKEIPPGGNAAAATLTAWHNLLKKEPNDIRSLGKILATLDSMKPEDIFAIAVQLTSRGNLWDEDESQLRRVLFSKLAELDPDRALTTAMGAKDHWSRLNGLIPVIQRLSDNDPAAAEAAVLKIPQGQMRMELAARLASFMAQTDGPGAAAMLTRLKLPSGDASWSSLYSSWAASDPGAASAALMALPRDAALRSLSSMCEAWALRDPSGAVAWARSLTDPAMRSSALLTTITSLAQSNPGEATALASAQPVGERRNLLTRIADSLAAADGPKAIEWTKSLTDPAEHQRCLARIVYSASRADIASAKEAIAQLPPGAVRSDALGYLVRHMSYSDPNSAKEWVMSLPAYEQTQWMGSFLTPLSIQDPAEAERLARDLPPSRANEHIWRNIASNKAVADPAGTLTWAATLDTEQARQAATRAAFETWSGHSPAEAAKALNGITDANLRRNATETLARTWASRSPAEAEQWAASLSGDDRFTALSTVWNATAIDDPQRAARSLVTTAQQADSATAIDKLSASAASIASAWTGQNPSEAAAWALTLPDGKLREEALGKVAGEWARYDPEAVSVWINSLPQDRSRDYAIGQLVNQIASTDPTSAFTWASSMAAGEKQIEVLNSAAATWKNQDPDAARAAIQNSSLPDEVKARVMESIR
jgi:hypothetical protein